MKKRTYKRMKNRLYREIKARTIEWGKRVEAESRILSAEATARYYKRRFREFGNNVETVDMGGHKGYVEQLKWELRPDEVGYYMQNEYGAGSVNTRRELTEHLVQGLIENNLIQFIEREPCEYGGPLEERYTIGAKLYVVPWEQMPHKRTMELRQWVDSIENDREGLL